MLRRNTAGEAVGLNEIFADLDRRLFELNDYRVSVYHKTKPDEDNSEFYLKDIKDQIFNFNPSEAIPKIDAEIASLLELQDRGVAIIEKVKVEVGDWIQSDLTHTVIQTTNGIIYEEISNELQSYIDTFSMLRSKIIQINPHYGKDQVLTGSIPVVINIDGSFKLPEMVKDAGPVKLDIYQSALLFDYLRESRIIQNYSNASLAKILSVLTGHSEQNLRTNKGFGAIAYIKSDKEKNKSAATGDFYNLTQVKEALLEIISIIDAEIKIEKEK
jgi:hypothetical protein